MSKRSKSTQPVVPDVGGLFRGASRLILIGLAIAILVLLVQHKNEVHTYIVSDTLITTNISNTSLTILTLLEEHHSETQINYTILHDLLIAIQNDTTTLNQLLLLVDQNITTIYNLLLLVDQNITALNQLLILVDQNITTLNQLLILVDQNITTLNQLLILVDQNITALNQLLIMVKNDTTQLLLLLQMHNDETLRWLIGTEDVNGTFCNDYEPCTRNIIMPDSTCRYPQKTSNSTCFNEDVCHRHPVGVDPDSFKCNTEYGPQGLCLAANHTLCKGWCTGNFSTTTAECRPAFPVFNSSVVPLISFSCNGHSCMAFYSASYIGNGGAGINGDCTAFFNTTSENTTITSNRTEYIDHCVASDLLLGYSFYTGCAWRYKCAELDFTANGASSVASLAMGEGAHTKVCVPRDPRNPLGAYEEIEAYAFFMLLPGEKVPTDRQYEQMVAEYHMGVWGKPDCPSSRRRAERNPQPGP